LATLGTLALLAYANSFGAGLTLDNKAVIAQDTRIQQATGPNIELIFNQSYWYRSGTSTLYRPFTTLSYLFNYTILHNGAAPAGYHWVNLLLHTTNVALVYFLGLLLFEEFWPAFVLAALWAVHPVLTESVTNIVGRADLLAAFGVLASLQCYVRSLASSGRGAILWLCALLAASSIAMFSKESGIAAVAIVILYDLMFCRSAPRRSRQLGYLAAALPVAVFLWLRHSVIVSLPAGHPAFTDNPISGADFVTGRLTAVKVLGKYLWLIVWPSRLSSDYSYNQIPLFSWRMNSWEDWQPIVVLAFFIGAVTVATICYRQSRRHLLFFTAFFFLSMAATANLLILIGTIMAERLLYLPSVAAIGFLVWTGLAVYRRFLSRWAAARIGTAIVLGAILLALCARTLIRNADWLDDRSLWASAAKASPNSYKVHQHLALLALEKPDGSEAARVEIDKAIAIVQPLSDDKKVPSLYATAGFCYRAKGATLAPEAAAEWYQKSLELLLEGRRLDQAEYREMVRFNELRGVRLAPTGEPAIYMELGRTYLKLGRPQQAIEAFDYGRRIKPRAEFFEEMAIAYRAAGNPGLAAITLLEAIEMGVGDRGRLAAQAVKLYRETAPTSCAVAGDGAATGVNLNCPMVREQLCLASKYAAELDRQMGQENDALASEANAVGKLGCPQNMF
jgi:tetratricopeptide (TPR) repeat protein